VSVPVKASSVVANSTIPFTVVLASGSSPEFVPEFKPTTSDVNAIVPVVFGSVYVTSAPETADIRVASCPSAAVPSNITPLDVDTVSTLFVVVVPITVNPPVIVTCPLANVIRSASSVCPMLDPFISTLSISKEPPLIRPVVVIAEAPLFIVPKSEVIEPEFKAPTDVKEEVTTVD